jgi:hypothetical protein
MEEVMLSSFSADERQLLVWASVFFSAFIVSVLAAALAYALMVRPSK